MERATPGVAVCSTQCAHILSESTTAKLDNADRLSSSGQDSGNAWTIIEAFGYPGIRDELSGVKLHSLQNTLTLDAFLYGMVDNLTLWLEPTVRRRLFPFSLL